MFKGLVKRIAKNNAEHTMLEKMGFTHKKPTGMKKKPTGMKKNTTIYK